MVADHPLTPDKLRGLARKLNHFGGVAISEEGVEFDGDDVEWSDVDGDPHPQPDRVPVHRRRRQADRQAAAAVVPVPRQGDRGDLAGGADAAARRGQTAARRRRDSRSGSPPRCTTAACCGTRELSPGMLAAVVLADPAVRSVFRGDGAGARRRDLPRRRRRDGGRRPARRADQVDAGSQAPTDFGVLIHAQRR